MIRWIVIGSFRESRMSRCALVLTQNVQEHRRQSASQQPADIMVVRHPRGEGISREDFHLKEGARARRTSKKAPLQAVGDFFSWLLLGTAGLTIKQSPPEARLDQVDVLLHRGLLGLALLGSPGVVFGLGHHVEHAGARALNITPTALLTQRILQQQEIAVGRTGKIPAVIHCFFEAALQVVKHGLVSIEVGLPLRGLSVWRWPASRPCVGQRPEAQALRYETLH